MKKCIIWVALLITTISFGQERVQLRDLSFAVPKGWDVLSKDKYAENYTSTLKYSGFYQLGGLCSDSLAIKNTPNLKYQFYEIPDMNTQPFDSIVGRQVAILKEDFSVGKVVAKELQGYFYTNITVSGQTILYGCSAGQNGILHVQIFVDGNQLKEGIAELEKLLLSVSYKSPYLYEDKYQEHVNEGAESTKMIFIFGAITLLVYILRRLFITKEKQ